MSVNAFKTTTSKPTGRKNKKGETIIQVMATPEVESKETDSEIPL